MYIGYGNNLYSLATRSLRIARQRTLFTISIFLILFFLLIVRLAQIMVFGNKDKGRSSEFIPSIISRADIFDRNESIVATSLPTVSLYACPHEIMNIEESAEKIIAVLEDLNKDDIVKKLSSNGMKVDKK